MKPSRGPQEQPFVEASGAISSRVDRDVPIADRLDLADDGGGRRRIQRTRQFVAAELDTGEIVVVPYAADTEAEGSNRLLGTLDLAKFFVGDLVVIRNARGQTRRGGLVPAGQAGTAGKLTDFRFSETHFVERLHAEIGRLDGRGDSRRGRPRQRRRPPLRCGRGDPSQVRVQLVLAEVTAIGGVRAVVRPLELAGVDNLVIQPELVCDLERKATVPSWIARAVRGNSQCPVAERVVGHVGQVRAVDAPAIGNDDRPDRGERLSQGACFLDPSILSSCSPLVLSSLDIVLIVQIVVIVVIIVVGREVQFEGDANDLEREPHWGS